MGGDASPGRRGLLRDGPGGLAVGAAAPTDGAAFDPGEPAGLEALRHFTQEPEAGGDRAGGAARDVHPPNAAADPH